MHVTPLGDKIVVKRIEAEDQTAGGIVLPDSAKEKQAEGRVLSIGDGRMLKSGRRVEPQVIEGDRILFSSYAGTDIKIDGEELLILSESDVLAIVS